MGPFFVAHAYQQSVDSIMMPYFFLTFSDRIACGAVTLAHNFIVCYQNKNYNP